MYRTYVAKIGRGKGGYGVDTVCVLEMYVHHGDPQNKKNMKKYETCVSHTLLKFAFNLFYIVANGNK